MRRYCINSLICYICIVHLTCVISSCNLKTNNYLYETVAFSEVANESVIEQIEIDEPVYEGSSSDVHYNPDTGLIEGYVNFDSVEYGTHCDITFRVINLSEGHIPDSLNIYRINSPLDPNNVYGDDIFDLSIVTSEEESHEELSRNNVQTDSFSPAGIWTLPTATIRMESVNDSLYSGLYEAATEAFPERNVFDYLLTYDYIPVTCFDEAVVTDGTDLSSLCMSKVLIRESINGIPFGSASELMRLNRSPVYYEGERGAISSLSNVEFNWLTTDEGMLEIVLPNYVSLAVSEENMPIKTLEECITMNLEHLNEFGRCGSQYDTNKFYNVYAAELIYIPFIPGVRAFDVTPEDEGLLIPVWVLYWQQINEDEDCYRDALVIDAVSGEIIMNGLGM